MKIACNWGEERGEGMQMEVGLLIWRKTKELYPDHIDFLYKSIDTEKGDLRRMRKV